MSKFINAAVLGTALVGFAATPVLAQTMPTMAQCEKGWDKSMEWTEAQFTKACADMAKKKM